MKHKKKLIAIIAVIIIAVVAGVCYKVLTKKEDGAKTYYYLGTVNEVTIFNDKKSRIDKSLNEANDILSSIHNKMSLQVDGSEINKVNEAAGVKPVKVSDLTLNVVKEGIKYAKLSNGKLDPSIGAVSTLWNIGTDKARVPSQEEISEAIKHIDYKKIEINDKNKTVYLKEKGMKLDLGAIAKGYAADLIADMLRKNEVKSSIINLGGNIYTVGKKGDRNFKIGIQDPNHEEKTAVGYIEASDTSIVTSGIYERFIREGDKVYHHILNPKTGYPFENELNSVSIISKKSIDGDALSTSVFGLGLKDGMKLVEKLDDVEAVFITKDKKVYLSPGLKDKFTVLENSYKVQK